MIIIKEKSKLQTLSVPVIIIYLRRLHKKKIKKVREEHFRIIHKKEGAPFLLLAILQVTG
jgi:hypothetical protein